MAYSIMYRINGRNMEVFFTVKSFFAKVNGKTQQFTEVVNLWLDDKVLMKMDELESVDTLVLFNLKHYREIKHKIEATFN